MTITLEIPPHLEAQLRASAADGDTDAVRRLLLEAVAPVAASLLGQPAADLTVEEFDNLLDELDDLVDDATAANPPVLSDHAVSRAGIYEAHP